MQADDSSAPSTQARDRMELSLYERQEHNLEKIDFFSWQLLPRGNLVALVGDLTLYLNTKTYFLLLSNVVFSLPLDFCICFKRLKAYMFRCKI